MTTLVGKQSDFGDALNELLELDYDAVEAYQAAIDRLETPGHISKLTEFMGDHKRHITELTELLKKENKKPSTGPSGKQWLTKGKVVLANLVGEKTILSAMHSNEEDTNTAYNTMNDRTDKWPDSVSIISKGLEDERRHKAWLESILDKEKV